MLSSSSLEPLGYHREIVEFLQTEERDVWEWFSSRRVRNTRAEAVRLELLKTSYRLDRDSAPRLHELAGQAAGRLEMDVPVTLYQAQRSEAGLNVSLAFLPDEAHIVLHGPISEMLSDAELLAVLGHELTHLMLLTRWDEQFLRANQVLLAMAGDSKAHSAHFATLRLFQLSTEIFCDRGSLVASGELDAAVSVLVKLETELKEVHAASYLRQADEIFSAGEARTDGITHPECYIRARSLKLWSEQQPDAEEEIRRMLEGPARLRELDLLGQRRVAGLTRRMLDQYLGQPWLRSEAQATHARLYFDDYQPPESAPLDAGLAEDLKTSDDDLKNYYCYVLLDLVTAENSFEEEALAAAFVLAEQLDLQKHWEPIVRKELSLRKKQLVKLRDEAREIVSRAQGIPHASGSLATDTEVA